MPELPELDTEHPNPARMYDYYLGGYHNFEVDRQAARAAEAAWPGAARAAQANRSFLRRAVRFLVGQGIDQFLDLGSGVPTVGNVHEIAQAANPDAKVVYVDVEPIAVKASELLLADTPNATVIHADLRATGAVLGHERLGLLDLARPVAVIFASVLPFVPDADDPASIVRTYLDATAAGSYLAISHPDDTARHQADSREIVDLYTTRTTAPFALRSPEAIRALFAGTEPVPPGVVHVADWRPDDDHTLEAYRDRTPIHVGIGRKL